MHWPTRHKWSFTLGHNDESLHTRYLAVGAAVCQGACRCAASSMPLYVEEIALGAAARVSPLRRMSAFPECRERSVVLMITVHSYKIFTVLADTKILLDGGLARSVAVGY